MDKKDDDAMMIAKIVKEESEPTVNPMAEARKMAVRKMMAAMKSEDADMFITAMDELKEIEHTEPEHDNPSDY